MCSVERPKEDTGKGSTFHMWLYHAVAQVAANKTPMEVHTIRLSTYRMSSSSIMHSTLRGDSLLADSTFLT